MSLPRMIVASLVYCLTIASIGGNAQTSLSDAAAMAPSGFLYSVDVLLDDSESPVVLGIRDGQTVAQVCFKGSSLAGDKQSYRSGEVAGLSGYISTAHFEG